MSTSTLTTPEQSNRIFEDGFSFNGNHRCDACGSQAFVRATKQADNGATHDLLFCGHHGRKSMDKLKEQKFAVLDRTDLINPEPSKSSA